MHARTPAKPRNWGAAAAGLVAGVVSSLCCLPAAVAFALGLSGSSFLVGLGLYRPYFVMAGLGFASLATWWALARRRQCGSPASYRRNRLLIPTLTLGTLVASYALINLVMLPWLYGSP